MKKRIDLVAGPCRETTSALMEMSKMGKMD